MHVVNLNASEDSGPYSICVFISDGLDPRGRWVGESPHHGQPMHNSVSWKKHWPWLQHSRNQSHSSPTFKSLKTLKTTPVSEVDVEYRHAQQASGLGPSVLTCWRWFREHARKVGRMRMAIQVWHCYHIVINPFHRHVMAYCQVSCVSSLISHGSWQFRHGEFPTELLEAQKMWDNKKFAVGLKGWRKRKKTWVSCCGMHGEPNGLCRFVVNFLPGDRS